MNTFTWKTAGGYFAVTFEFVGEGVVLSVECVRYREFRSNFQGHATVRREPTRVFSGRPWDKPPATRCEFKATDATLVAVCRAVAAEGGQGMYKAIDRIREIMVDNGHPEWGEMFLGAVAKVLPRCPRRMRVEWLRKRSREALAALVRSRFEDKTLNKEYNALRAELRELTVKATRLSS